MHPARKSGGLSGVGKTQRAASVGSVGVHRRRDRLNVIWRARAGERTEFRRLSSDAPQDHAAIMMRLRTQHRGHEIAFEYTVGHYLAAFHQAIFGWAVIGDCPMDRADVVPHQDVTLGPVMRIAKLGLELVGKEIVEHLFALSV